MPTPLHILTGIWGEAQAAHYLTQKGLRVLARRVRLDARDEIDLLARDETALVFVEVKTRRSEEFGRPISSVDRRKRHALCRAALRYMRKLREQPPAFRFDVVEVIGWPFMPTPLIRHIENAFPLEKRYFVMP
ncbi:MAG: YraN family protein [Kiritimatiellia bacterium]